MTKYQVQNIPTKWFWRHRNKRISADPNFIPKILLDDEIAGRINSLNSKQRRVFNMVHIWAKDYVKYDGDKVWSAPMFLSGSGGTGKSHSVKVIQKGILKWKENIKKGYNKENPEIHKI